MNLRIWLPMSENNLTIAFFKYSPYTYGREQKKLTFRNRDYVPRNTE